MTLTRTRVALLTGLLAFAFFATAINCQPHGWVDWYHLANSGQVAVATVTQLEPENHQSCLFSYAIGSHVYASSAGGCAVPAGQRVVVTYLPSDPSFVSLQSPREQFTFLVSAPIIMSVFGGLLASWRWARKQGQRAGA
jgi:hypothetical protein